MFHFIFQWQNYKNWFNDFLIAGGTPKNGGPKVVHTRSDSTAGSGSSAQAGGEVYVSKAAPGRTFFDDIFNVISCFLLSPSSISHLFCPSASSALRIFPDFLSFPSHALYLYLSFLSPYFFPSSHFYIFFTLVSFLIVYFVSHPFSSSFPYSSSEGR